MTMRKSSLIVWLLVAAFVVIAVALYWQVGHFLFYSTPRLSQDQVGDIARQAVIEHKKRLEDYELPVVQFFC